MELEVRRRGPRGRCSFSSRMRTCTRSLIRVTGRVRRCVVSCLVFLPLSSSTTLPYSISRAIHFADGNDRPGSHRRPRRTIRLCARNARLQVWVESLGAGHHGHAAVEEYGERVGARRFEGVWVRSFLFTPLLSHLRDLWLFLYLEGELIFFAGDCRLDGILYVPLGEYVQPKSFIEEYGATASFGPRMFLVFGAYSRTESQYLNLALKDWPSTVWCVKQLWRDTTGTNSPHFLSWALPVDLTLFQLVKAAGRFLHLITSFIRRLGD